MPPLPSDVVVDIVRRALAEDVGSGDVTTESTVPETQAAHGVFLVKQRLVLAGIAVVRETFRQVDSTCVVKFSRRDGDLCQPGDIIGEVESLRLRSVSLVQPLSMAEAAQQEAKAQLNLLSAQFDAGQIDTLTLLEGKQQWLLASRAVLEAQSALQRASWALEQALQIPLPIVKPNE